MGFNIIIVWEKDYKENLNYILNYLDTYLNYESCSF
jgi:hypothetical protein